MRKLTVLAAVVFLISCYGMNANAQSAVKSSFVGVSASVTNGAGGGFMGMNLLCQQTFGASAHMCTWDEFYYSAGALPASVPQPVPRLPNVALGLWASVSWHNCGAVNSKFECQASDSDSWVAPPAPLAGSCNAWSSRSATASGSAVIVQIRGIPLFQTLGFVQCATLMPVACCAP